MPVVSMLKALYYIMHIPSLCFPLNLLMYLNLSNSKSYNIDEGLFCVCMSRTQFLFGYILKVIPTE